MTIVDAATELYATAVDGDPAHLMVVLRVDVGDRAPDDTVDMAPAYERDGTAPDPVRLREVCWTNHDGDHTIQRIDA
jgi:hypothetical protein